MEYQRKDLKSSEACKQASNTDKVPILSGKAEISHTDWDEEKCIYKGGTRANKAHMFSSTLR